MIYYKSGNIIMDDSEAIINTVNCVGVMGKGLALQFKKSFPENFTKYKTACDKKQVKIGQMYITTYSDVFNKKYIINFPTKNHWRGKSKYEYIESGLNDLINKIHDYNIKSIAIPPLGAGLGGLDWLIVKQIILDKLSPLNDVVINIYEPSNFSNTHSKKKPSMTQGRALLLKLLDIYSSKGYECTSLEAQKLAYFLQEYGINLNLKYHAHNFSPYADNLNNVLTHINGYFISRDSEKSEITIINNSLEQADNILSTNPENNKLIDKVARIIEGYETPLSIEILAKVHWVIKQENCDRSDFDSIKNIIYTKNDHNTNIKEKYLHKAFLQLQNHCFI